jgi:hypothetical protein
VSQPPPRRTSTVSEARIISSPKTSSPDKPGTDPSGNPPKTPAGR